MNTDRLLSVGEARLVLGLPSDNAARIAVSRCQIPFVKIGSRLRFSEKSLSEFIESKKVEVPP
tara:strand:- start:13 stop:201 length:189 start_codon:yes stop_codon:yes gene_type:complete